jgi:hypothetical protein
MNKTKKVILISLIGIVVVITTSFVVRRIRKGKSLIRNTDKNKNYIIGDSQSPFIDKNSEKAILINKKGGKSSLWEDGKNLSWLKSAVDDYPVSKSVNSIIINIGTNGGFNQKDDVEGLVNSVKEKFPNALLFVVKGSWGWGENKDLTEAKVNSYYDKFKELGVEIIKPAIGKVKDPHSNLPIYAKIGSEIDKKIK